MLFIPSADAQRLPVACLLERSLLVKTIPEEYLTHVASHQRGSRVPVGIPLRPGIAARNFFKAICPIRRLAMVGLVRREDVPNWHHCRAPGVPRDRFRGLLGHPLGTPMREPGRLESVR